jgi:hypothetical protein
MKANGNIHSEYFIPSQWLLTYVLHFPALEYLVTFVFRGKGGGGRPPVCSSGQSSWLQIQRSGFDSWRYQIFWEVVCLERGPLSLVSTTEELLGRKSRGSGLESRDHGSRDLSRWPRGTLYPQKLVLNSPTSGGRSVGIVRSRTQATEFSFRRGLRPLILVRLLGLITAVLLTNRNRRFHHFRRGLCPLILVRLLGLITAVLLTNRNRRFHHNITRRYT